MPAGARDARPRVERHGGRVAAGMFDANVRCADFLRLDAGCGLDPRFIVANPPYVSATHLAADHKVEYGRRFGSAWGRLDLYGLFLEHSLDLLEPGGVLSFVTPDKWLTSASSRRLRGLVAARGDVRSVARFDRHDLFPGVATVPCVSVLAKEPRSLRPIRVEWYDVDADGVPRPSGRSDTIHPDLRGSPWLPVNWHARRAHRHARRRRRPYLGRARHWLEPVLRARPGRGRAG